MKRPLSFIKMFLAKQTIKKTKRSLMNSKSIIFETTNKVLSSYAGLSIFQTINNFLKLEENLSQFIPKKSGPAAWKKFWSILVGFIAGADCLDDFDHLRDDACYNPITGGGIASTTAGEFLRSFSKFEVEQLSHLHTQQAFLLRQALFPQVKELIINMDSTPHEQTGLKMEGVGYNYKNQWCLDSQNAYDQFGISYGFHLRAGNTYSGNDAEWMIGQIFKIAPHTFDRYFRADSAYANLGIYNTLINAQVSFAIALKENVYSSILKKNNNLIKWKKTKLVFFDSKNCEITNTLYPIKGLAGGKSHLRVVIIRAPKEGQQDLLSDGYHYYAIVTNMGEHQMTAEKIINFYRGRANAENYIREQKYGFDFLHFPCKKLSANYVYGLIGSIAYNMMRFVSYLIDKKHGCFSKKVRRMIVHIPCQVVKHARYTIFRMNQQAKEVIEKCSEEIFCLFSGFQLRSD